jgi:uncharacterized membrane protein
MSAADEAQQRIENYLNEVQKRLRGLGPEQVREIIAELRSHILERDGVVGELTADRVSPALNALGPPDELARAYTTDEVLARAEISRTPWRLLDSLFGWATTSLAGFVVLLVTLSGYFLGVVFLLVAALKPFHPATAGLWALRDRAGDLELSIRMGFGIAPSIGHELLGWGIIPLGMVAGCGLVVGTTRFALWCVRIYRRSRAPRLR